MPQKKRKRYKYETAARPGPSVPLDELMAFPETVRRSEERTQASMAVSWLQWSRTMRDVDPDTMLLLWGAFQAGYEARR